ncbi:PAS domain S-box protein [Desulfatiglans anilini]|uniref:PAS domain S-box protein n=1 Tax=Desulfatiglans anilini TaxID=90728 RepID=UPI0004038719|nr:PAS domain S-box protein [Desulfatiglans anilini]
MRTLAPKFSSLLLESMADGVFTFDEQGRITSWNPSIERITGYSAEEAGRRLGVSHTAVWKYMKKWGIPLRK